MKRFNRSTKYNRRNYHLRRHDHDDARPARAVVRSARIASSSLFLRAHLRRVTQIALISSATIVRFSQSNGWAGNVMLRY